MDLKTVEDTTELFSLVCDDLAVFRSSKMEWRASTLGDDSFDHHVGIVSFWFVGVPSTIREDYSHHCFAASSAAFVDVARQLTRRPFG